MNVTTPRPECLNGPCSISFPPATTNDISCPFGLGRAKNTRLNGIQALRAVAALLVVAYHVGRHLDRGLSSPKLVQATLAGHAGVDLFFVISGFIILFVHSTDLDNPARLKLYVFARIIRIYPMYWLAVTSALALTVVARHEVDPHRVMWSLSLLPTMLDPLLGVDWTLQYEIVFYILVATLIANVRLGLVLLSAWFIGVTANLLDAVDLTSFPAALYGSYGVEFGMGAAVALLIRRGKFRCPRALAVVGAGLFITVSLAEIGKLLNGYGPGARFAYGGSAAILVAGLASHELRREIRVQPLLRYLGSTSYSIYLFHLTFLGIAWQLVLRFGLSELPVAALFLGLSSFVVGGGLAIGILVEAPLLRASRRLFAPPVSRFREGKPSTSSNVM